jgi:hypothetical protein
MSVSLLYLVINYRKWVLSKFSEKLLLNQLFIFIKMLISFLNSEGLEFVIIILVSYANKIGLGYIRCNFWKNINVQKKMV